MRFLYRLYGKNHNASPCGLVGKRMTVQEVGL
jgi:hypothetical protein